MFSRFHYNFQISNSKTLFKLQACLLYILQAQTNLIGEEQNHTFSTASTFIRPVSLKAAMASTKVVMLKDVHPKLLGFSVIVKVDRSFNYEWVSTEGPIDEPSKSLRAYDVVFYDTEVYVLLGFIENTPWS